MAKAMLTPQQLGQPAGAVAKGLARLLLLRSLEESARLQIGAVQPGPVAVPRARPVANEDPEAVHDFRVALRRLRSWLRAFRPLLGNAVTRRSERRLRRLSRVAGPARDIQVQRALLAEMAASRRSPAALEARRIERTIAKEEVRAARRLIRCIVDDLSRTTATLAAQLHRGPASGPEPTMAVAMAVLLAHRLERLEMDLKGLKRSARIEPAHAARIAVKRLRYLLEAFGSSSRLAASAVLRLTALQDELGRLHDVQLLSQRLADLRAKPVLRARVRRKVLASLRSARQLARSRDIGVARKATTRLIRRLERR